MNYEIERVPYRDRESWLRTRLNDVTASAAAALYRGPDGKSAHPYMTRDQLIAEKRDGVVEPENGLMWRGRIFEPAVMAAVKDMRTGWKSLRFCKQYLRVPAARFGATPDATAKVEGKLTCLQFKTANPRSFSKSYADGRAPMYAQVQVAMEAFVTGAERAIVVCLEVEPYRRPRVSFCEVKIDLGFVEHTLALCKSFWDELEPGWQPKQLSKPVQVSFSDLVAATPVESKFTALQEWAESAASTKPAEPEPAPARARTPEDLRAEASQLYESWEQKRGAHWAEKNGEQVDFSTVLWESLGKNAIDEAYDYQVVIAWMRQDQRGVDPETNDWTEERRESA